MTKIEAILEALNKQIEILNTLESWDNASRNVIQHEISKLNTALIEMES